MATYLNVLEVGILGTKPRFVFLATDSSLAEVLVTGYVNSVQESSSVSMTPYDFVFVGYDSATQLEICVPSFAPNGIITLIPYASEGVIEGGISLGGEAIFAGISGTDLLFKGLVAGTNTSIVPSADYLTINSTGVSIFVWNDVTTDTQALESNMGYITDNGATLVTYTLPSVVDQGAVINVSGYSSGGWQVNQNSGQQIFFGDAATTIGTGGSLASTNQYDQISLLCTLGDTNFVVLSSIGNIAYV